MGAAADSSKSLAAEFVLVCFVFPCGTFTPRATPNCAPQTPGVYNGAPIPLSKIPKNSQNFPCKRHAPAPRKPPLPLKTACITPRYIFRPHTTVAIKQAYPGGISSPAPNQTAAQQTHGVYLCTQVLNNRCGLLCPAGGADYENYENYENYEICCWCAVCIALPCGNSARCITQWSLFRPSPTRQRHANPRGISLHSSFE